jgi:hypothetical protein
MSDVNISKFRAQVVRDGSKPATPGFVVSEGQSPTDPAGSGQNHLPVTIAAASTGLAITESQILGGAGTVAQYIRGDGSLADFPATTGGGSSVSYYLNGSVSQGTIGGVAYREVNRNPVFGAGTDIVTSSNGYIANFITDAGDPNKLLIPAGNWNLETYFSASSGGGSPTFYVELYKYDGTTFTLIATSSGTPELIAFGTNINPYFSTLAVPETILTLTDRLALRYYVNTSGRTITLHTENGHLCQVITTFTTGLTALNGLTTQVQFFAVGTSGSDFNIASSVDTHTFNLPTASGTNRGALSSTDWTTFNNKENAITAGTTAQYFRGDKTFQTLNTSVVPEGTNLYYTEARVNANTNVAANTAARHNAVTLGTANGLSLSTQVLSLGLASAGVTGALSGTDWSTFNNKQNALTNPVTGTGTTNYLPKFTGASTIGDSVIADNATEINIPKRIFLNSGGQSIFFTPNLSSSSNRIEGSSGVPLEIFTSGSELRLAAGGVSTQVTLLSSGNVGIGTTSPSYPLQVRRAGGAGSLGISIDSVGTTDRVAQYFAIQDNSFGAGTGHAFYYRVPSSTTDVLGLFLNESGNLLVGTTTDAGFKLDVNGTGRFSGSLSGSGINAVGITLNNNNAVRFYRAGLVEMAYIGWTNENTNNSTWYFKSSNGNPIAFSADGVNQQLFINTSGNVGIGTTSPASKLHIEAPTASYGQFRILNTTSGSGEASIHLGRTDQAIDSRWTIGQGTAGIGNDFGFYSAGNRLVITTGGNVGIGTNSPGVRFVNSGATLADTPTFGSGTIGANAILSANGLYGLYTGVSSAGHVWQQVQRNDGSTAVYPLVLQPSGGNVLIGTTTDSGSKLNVNGRIQGQEFFSVGSLNDTDGSFLIDHPGVQTWKIGITNNNTSTFSIGNDNGGSFAAKYFNITNGGNVGIGTTSPNSRLHVAGDFRTVLTSGVGGDTLIAAISGVSNGYIINVDTSNNITHTWNTGANAAALRITPGGNVLIGTTTDNGAKLNVNGTIRSNDTNGLGLGSIAGYRRVQYGSDNATSFTLLTDGNAYAGLYALSANFSSTIKTGNPTGSTSDNWLLGRALVSGSSTPDRWIRVQIGNLYYDILAVYMGSV